TLVQITIILILSSNFFLFNDPPTTKIYTLSLHDALPICVKNFQAVCQSVKSSKKTEVQIKVQDTDEFIIIPKKALTILSTVIERSEEHTSELQSRENLVCRLLLEKKKNKIKQ